MSSHTSNAHLTILDTGALVTIGAGIANHNKTTSARSNIANPVEFIKQLSNTNQSTLIIPRSVLQEVFIEGETCYSLRRLGTHTQLHIPEQAFDSLDAPEKRLLAQLFTHLDQAGAIRIYDSTEELIAKEATKSLGGIAILDDLPNQPLTAEGAYTPFEKDAQTADNSIATLSKQLAGSAMVFVLSNDTLLRERCSPHVVATAELTSALKGLCDAGMLDSKLYKAYDGKLNAHAFQPEETQAQSVCDWAMSALSQSMRRI